MKADPSKTVKDPQKIKKPSKKPRSPSPIAQEDLESRTILERREDATIQHVEEDIAATLEPTPTQLIMKESSPIPSFVPPTDDFKINTPPPSSITTIILISTIPLLSPMISIRISFP